MRGEAVSRRWIGATLAAIGSLVVIAQSVEGLGRSYSYDEAVTVDLFVRQGSLYRALTEQRVFNNHPLLSATNWIVWHLGGITEGWQRVVPLLATVATVAVIAVWVNRRYGMVPSACCTALAATNPAVIDLGQQARGYSLAAFFATAATLLLEEWLSGGRWRHGLYATSIALGLLSHLFVGLVILSHWAWVFARRQDLRIWEYSALIGTTTAGAVYFPMSGKLLAQGSSGSGTAHPDFLVSLASELAGGIGMGLLLIGLLGSSIALSRRMDVAIAASTVAGALGFVLVVVQPQHLYPRFLAWIVPLGAVAIAPLVRRSPALVVVIAPIALVWVTGDDARPVQLDIRAAADVYDQLRHGGTACTHGAFAEALLVYEDVVSPSEGRPDCAFVLLQQRNASLLPAEFTIVGRPESAPQFCVAVAGEGWARRHFLRNTIGDLESCSPGSLPEEGRSG